MRKVLLSVLLLTAGWLGFAAPSSAAPVEEIRIGVLYPLTGGAAAEGRELRNGVELAQRLINEKVAGVDLPMAKQAGVPGLKGAKITLIIKDHEGNPTLGADLAKKLILDDKVHGILGAYHSSVTKAVSAVCEEQGIPMINDSSTSPALTQRGFKWFWRTTPHDTQFTKDLFEFLKGLTEGKAKGVPKVAKADLDSLASACEKTEWGSHVSEIIEKLGPQYGFQVRKSILYAAKSPDLSSEVRSLMSAKPDAMLFASYASDAILMMKTLKAQKAAPKLVWGQNAGFEAPEFKETLGDDIVGVLTRTVFLPKLGAAKKVAAQVNKLYLEKYGNEMTGASARAFTGLQAWYHVLDKAKSTKPTDLQKAANSIEISGSELIVPWAGIKFNSSGDDLGQNALGRGIIGQYQKDKDGKIVLEIAYPFEMATAPLVYPFKGY